MSNGRLPIARAITQPTVPQLALSHVGIPPHPRTVGELTPVEMQVLQA